MQRVLLVVFAFAIFLDAFVLPNRTYGLLNCPCVGIDNREGEALATIKGGMQVPYPADLGGRCKAWDAGNHPKCPGESWCESKWCYVDPCNCDKVSPYPRPALYLPDAQYQGKPVHFSYATCGGMDSFSETGAGSDRETIVKACAVHVDSAKWGHEDCRCIGIAPQAGTIKLNADGKQVDFPADTGGQCKAWEKGNHPECKGGSLPSWCDQPWCYADPCKCKASVPPKTSDYVPGSNYQGRPVYYSYATCGGTDSWTANKHTASCVNQKSKDACKNFRKCAWNGQDCLGKELVETCSEAFGLNAIMALALLVLFY